MCCTMGQPLPVNGANVRQQNLFPDSIRSHVLGKAYLHFFVGPESSYSLRFLACLLAYTQPELLASAQPRALEVQMERSFKGSQWAKMVDELVNFTLTSPCYFVAGVTLLCELLPIPLPMPTTMPYDGDHANEQLVNE